MSELSPPVVIYDMDGVITRRDSFTALVVERLRRSPLRLIRALPPAAVMPLLPPDARAAASRAITRSALRGVTFDEYERIARRVGARIGGDPAWIRAEIVARIRAEHAAGRRVVIATASERTLAAALLERAGVPRTRLSASLLVPGPHGVEIGDHRIGERKAEAICESEPIHLAHFVTDSATDLPTARRVASVELIGAGPRTRARFRAEGIEVRARAEEVPGPGSSP